MEWKLTYTLVVLALGWGLGWISHSQYTSYKVDRAILILAGAFSRQKRETVEKGDALLRAVKGLDLETAADFKAALDNWRDE